MAERGSYGQFCPVSMALEALGGRWTMLILREMLCGSTRFNDIRRGVPRMSPTLLSQRLKELAESGVIWMDRSGGTGNSIDYRLTAAGEDLRALVMGFGIWGQRWIESHVSLRNLDPSLLMWDMRRHLDLRPLPPKRCTIQFQYPELPVSKQHWWIVVDRGEADLCMVDPGFEIDLLVRGSLRCMTSIWMGLSTVAQEVGAGHLSVDGDMAISNTMQRWLGLSPFAREQRQVA